MAELIKGQLELQKQMQELKSLLQGNQGSAQGARGNILFNIAGAPAEGDVVAPVTMIEFSDFQCPFCARYDAETFPRVEQDYVKTGKVRYVFSNFPLQNIHALARPLADAAQCVSEQKQFWQMRHLLLTHQAALTSDQAIVDLVKQLGIDLSAFQKCRQDGKRAEKLSQAIAEAAADGVSGTPTFFIGVNDTATDKVKVMKVIVGQQPYENFKQAIDAILTSIKPPGAKM